MPKLLGLIPQQNFELVTARIGAILAEEFEAQEIDEDLKPKAIWIERVVNFDHTDLPAINVSLEESSFDNDDQTQVDGTNNYNVDVYVSEKSQEGGQEADPLSAANVKRLAGMVRAILKHPGYRTLDFAPPSIKRVRVTGITYGTPQNESEALTTRMARVVVVVEVPETVELGTTTPLLISNTTVKLDETEKGYVYRIDNTVVLTPILAEDGEEITNEAGTTLYLE